MTITKEWFIEIISFDILLGIVTDDASHFEKVWEEIEVSFHECPSCYSAVSNKLFISSSFPVHVTFPNHILGHVHLYRVNNDDTDDDFVHQREIASLQKELGYDEGSLHDSDSASSSDEIH